MFFSILTNLVLFISTVMVFLNSPISSTLCLCVILLLSIMILFTSHVEFLSYIFILVYVGGIALLFLFVVIMLNLKLNFIITKKKFRLLTGPVFLFLVSLKFQNLLFVNLYSVNTTEFLGLRVQYLLSNDIYNFGIFFSHYFIYLIISGIILLLSMLGVLVISLGKLENNNNNFFLFEK